MLVAEFCTDKRGYVLILERDLFGDYVLHRRWFGLFNRRGGSKKEVFLDKDAAIKEFRRIEKLRARHGYTKLPMPG